MLDLRELERLAKEATPGPWEVVDARVFLDDEDFEIRNGGHCIGYGTGEKDAAYIVAACNAVPELIKMYREAEDKANKAWRILLEAQERIVEVQKRVRELEKALIELIKIEVPLPECVVCWERDRCTDRSHGDNCLAVGYIVDMAKEAAKEAENGQCKD